MDKFAINQGWRHHLNQLRNLGLKEDQKLFNYVRMAKPSTVENAIALFKAVKRYKNDFSPTTEDYFIKILNEEWGDRNITSVLKDPEMKYERKAIFDLWFEMANKIGAFNYWEDDSGSRYVARIEGATLERVSGLSIEEQSEGDRRLIQGAREKFIEAWGRGYTIAYLRKILGQESA